MHFPASSLRFCHLPRVYFVLSLYLLRLVGAEISYNLPNPGDMRLVRVALQQHAQPYLPLVTIAAIVVTTAAVVITSVNTAATRHGRRVSIDLRISHVG